MSISPGFTAEEIRDFVHDYKVVPHGQKTHWLFAQGVSYYLLQRWQSAVFEGDLDRGLILRDGLPMMMSPSERTALVKHRANSARG